MMLKRGVAHFFSRAVARRYHEGFSALAGSGISTLASAGHRARSATLRWRMLDRATSIHSRIALMLAHCCVVAATCQEDPVELNDVARPIYGPLIRVFRKNR